MIFPDRAEPEEARDFQQLALAQPRESARGPLSGIGCALALEQGDPLLEILKGGDVLHSAWKFDRGRT